MGGFQGFGPGIRKQIRKSFQSLFLPLQKLGIVDLVVGGQLDHGLLFLQDFQNDLDLQVGGIVFSDRAHNVLHPPVFLSKLGHPLYRVLLRHPLSCAHASDSRDFQHQSGIPTYGKGLHRSSEGPSHPNQYGWVVESLG